MSVPTGAPPGGSLRAAAAINDLRTQALLRIVQRLGRIDLSPILLYTIAGAPDSALPFLAWQFDMLAPWWQLLTDASSQRQLVQQAVALHRYKGTTFAIQSIARSLGFGLITIEEGQGSWDGTSWPADKGWAVFRVVVAKAAVTPAAETPASWDQITNVDLLIDVDSLQQAAEVTGAPVSGIDQSRLASAITFFKPARSWLDSLWFRELPETEPAISVADAVTLSAGPNVVEARLRIADMAAAPGWAVFDTKETMPVYDGHFYHAGITYGAAEPLLADSGVSIGAQPTE